MEIPLMAVSVVVAIAGILLATRYYKKKTTLADQERSLGAAYSVAYNKFYVDEIYDNTVVKPTYAISNSFLYKIVDVKIIDGIINGLAAIVGVGGSVFRKIQTGIVQNYAIVIVVGILLAVGYVITF
jgi:NADH-quinone oxidoreductase subunit L